jgi:hypothetical protein
MCRALVSSISAAIFMISSGNLPRRLSSKLVFLSPVIDADRVRPRLEHIGIPDIPVQTLFGMLKKYWAIESLESLKLMFAKWLFKEKVRT